MENKRINILVVDDEWNMRNLIRFYLNNEEWNILEASEGIEAIEKYNQFHPDLVILDIMMPGMDGWEVCKTIREKGNIPILLLTAINETKDKVYGLNLGADDYMTKPFDKDEFVARVKALLRRVSPVFIDLNKSTLEIDKITIKPDSREVFVDNQDVAFTPKEFDLLLLLAKNGSRAFGRKELLDQVWGSNFYGDFRTVDQHVKNIREKLKKAGCSFNPIETVWGLGYKLHEKKKDE